MHGFALHGAMSAFRFVGQPRSNAGHRVARDRGIAEGNGSHCWDRVVACARSGPDRAASGIGVLV